MTEVLFNQKGYHLSARFAVSINQWNSFYLGITEEPGEFCAVGASNKMKFAQKGRLCIPTDAFPLFSKNKCEECSGDTRRIIQQGQGEWIIDDKQRLVRTTSMYEKKSGQFWSTVCTSTMKAYSKNSFDHISMRPLRLPTEINLHILISTRFWMWAAA